jgi:hypothetical protein
MEKNFKVMLLVEDTKGFYDHYIMESVGNSRGDALLEVLADYAKTGGNLNKVKKTRVEEVLSRPSRSPTLVGLHAAV